MPSIQLLLGHSESVLGPQLTEATVVTLNGQLQLAKLGRHRHHVYAAPIFGRRVLPRQPCQEVFSLWHDHAQFSCWTSRWVISQVVRWHYRLDRLSFLDERLTLCKLQRADHGLTLFVGLGTSLIFLLLRLFFFRFLSIILVEAAVAVALVVVLGHEAF